MLPCCQYAAQNAILVFAWDMNARSRSYLRAHAIAKHGVRADTPFGYGVVSETAYALALLSPQMKQYDDETIIGQIRRLKKAINAQLDVPFIFTRLNVYDSAVLVMPDSKIIEHLDELPGNCLLPPQWQGLAKPTAKLRFWPTDVPILTTRPTMVANNGSGGACGTNPNNPLASIIIRVEETPISNSTIIT